MNSEIYHGRSESSSGRDEPDRPVASIRIFRRQSPVRVLGPGARAVIWVQGCPLACPGCIVPESWAADKGNANGEGSEYGEGRGVSVSDLAGWILAQPDIEGITLSGGEPMAQAPALSALIDAIRATSNLGVICYTGYTLEWISERGSADQRALLSRLDLLIDGPYIERLHAALRWRGSSNQRLIALTERYRNEIDELNSGAAREAADCTAGLEFFVDDRGAFGFVGVPATPGFRSEFEGKMKQRGLSL